MTTTRIMQEIARKRQPRPLTPEQTERAAALVRLMLLGGMTYPQVLDALPGQMPIGGAV